MTAPASRLFYLWVGLALAGAVLPFVIAIPWMERFGFQPGLFLRQAFANRASTAFAADLLLSINVFILFILLEGLRLRMKRLWLPVLLVVAVGLCCGLPAFLAMRERALAGRSAAGRE
jgi:lysylphosphatidylglycerol synthetase-like protein (DUF2156 family)